MIPDSCSEYRKRGRKCPSFLFNHCCLLHVACCMVHVACCLLHVACCLLPVACCKLHVACCMLPVAWCMVHGAWCMLHGACCMLHVACCMLHVASCMLHAPFEEIPTPLTISPIQNAENGEWHIIVFVLSVNSCSTISCFFGSNSSALYPFP
jgi:hypothetical protein